MDLFFLAFGLLLVFEGISVAAFPTAARRAADLLAVTPDRTLRIVGLVVAVLGIGLIWIVRRLS